MADEGGLDVRIGRDGSACVLTIAGELDIATCGELAGLAAPAMTGRAERLVLDLSGLRFIDSRGAAALAALADSADVATPVIVRSAGRAVRKVLDVLGISLERCGPVPGRRAEWLLLESRAVRSWAEETRTSSRQIRMTSKDLTAHGSQLRMRSQELRTRTRSGGVTERR
jgi:anti-sigma B factor antagonist